MGYSSPDSSVLVILQARIGEWIALLSSSRPRDWTWVSHNAGRLFTIRAIGEALYAPFSSVLFIRSVVSDSLWPHVLQHSRPPCPSPTPGVHLNPYSLSRWCHPNISSSVVPFSSCPKSFPASGSFQMSQLFTWGGQSIGVLVSTSVLPMNTQVWSPLGCTGWISLQSKGLSNWSSLYRVK